jgi:hypothetical protein
MRGSNLGPVELYLLEDLMFIPPHPSNPADAPE